MSVEQVNYDFFTQHIDIRYLSSFVNSVIGLQYWYTFSVVDSLPSAATSVVLVRAQDCLAGGYEHQGLGFKGHVLQRGRLIDVVTGTLQCQYSKKIVPVGLHKAPNWFTSFHMVSRMSGELVLLHEKRPRLG